MTQFEFGPEVVRSYKRLSYTTWHALAEFVDNSTQAYFNNREELNQIFEAEGDVLTVEIKYDAQVETLVIRDNSIGMDSETLDRAMKVGMPPSEPGGRSQYGMGLKTAACWFGDHWTVRTSRLGVAEEMLVEVDVEKIASGIFELPTSSTPTDASRHYTIIEISQMNQAIRGRTFGKIKDYLSSMYRDDLRKAELKLIWQGEELQWHSLDGQFLVGPDGREYYKHIEVSVDKRRVHGWVGVLASGGRSQAGFSMLRSGRVIKGWPESWRPEEIFGQIEGSNNLVNQRIVGEFHFDEFPVTHTKDDILWSGEEEAALERAIRGEINDFLIIAERTRVRIPSGPQRTAVIRARSTLREDLGQEPLVTESPPVETLEERRMESSEIASRYAPKVPDVSSVLFGRALRAYFSGEEGRDAIYAATQRTSDDDQVVVVANLRHPYLRGITSTEALDVYLRDLIVDVATFAESGNWTDAASWFALKDSLMRSMSPSEDA